MFRSGFPPTAEHPDGDHSIWGCSWYNPTGNTPHAMSTAVCLPADLQAALAGTRDVQRFLLKTNATSQ
jgi:hypothetical protein